ncbi:MAG: BamA/TamA family outer membrane protein [Alistipes sp.]
MGRFPALLCLLLCVVTEVNAQDSLYIRGSSDTLRYNYTPVRESDLLPPDTVKRKQPFLNRVINYFEQAQVDKTFEKKIDFSIVGGPSYSKNTSFGIGLLAAGLYRLDRTDSVTSPSNISIFASVSVSGFYSVGVMGNNIFAKNKSRIDYEVAFSSAPRSLWGVGYQAGAHNMESTYVEKHYLVTGRYLHRIFRNVFLGAMFDFEHTEGIKFTNESYLYGQHKRYTATGLGLLAEYDSRDFIPNPARGGYVSLQEMIFPKGLGNCGGTLWRTTFVANYFRPLWKGCIFAADLFAEFHSEGTPWPMLARMGGSQRMRGYYAGRYTDNDMITMQVELRQKIYRRIGCVVWGGAGNVFPRLAAFNWSQTLPNYGVGLRWEFKKRINVRLDYGFGKRTSGFLLNINEAF